MTARYYTSICRSRRNEIRVQHSSVRRATTERTPKHVCIRLKDYSQRPRLPLSHMVSPRLSPYEGVKLLHHQASHSLVNASLEFAGPSALVGQILTVVGHYWKWFPAGLILRQLATSVLLLLGGHPIVSLHYNLSLSIICTPRVGEPQGHVGQLQVCAYESETVNFKVGVSYAWHK